MTIRKVLTTLTVATALVSCSSDDIITTQDRGSEGMADDVEIIEPIRLGVGNTKLANVSRHAIDPKDAELNFDLDSIGVFMLAAYNQGTNPSAAVNAVNWDRASALHLQCTPIDNWPAKADVCTTELSTLLGGATFTQLYLYDSKFFTDKPNAEDSVFYYPVTSKYANRFYGYYPYQDAGNVTMTATQRKVHFDNLDGKTEILWGRSDVGDSNTARPATTDETKESLWKYSARYFRINETTAKSFPTIAFKHKLMAFQIAIQGVPDPKYPLNPYVNANKVYLDTVIIYSVPTKADLIVADYATPANDGKLTFTWDSDLQDIGLIGRPRLTDEFGAVTQEENDAALVKVQVHNDDIIKVGQRLLLPVPADANYEYTAHIRLRYALDPGDPSKDVYFDSESPISIEQVSSSATYTEGTVYTILLQIAGPQEVNIKATLDEWVDATGDEGITPIEFN